MDTRTITTLLEALQSTEIKDLGSVVSSKSGVLNISDPTLQNKQSNTAPPKSTN